jgi:hypothetical protein
MNESEAVIVWRYRTGVSCSGLDCADEDPGGVTTSLRVGEAPPTVPAGLDGGGRGVLGEVLTSLALPALEAGTAEAMDQRHVRLFSVTTSLAVGRRSRKRRTDAHWRSCMAAPSRCTHGLRPSTATSAALGVLLPATLLPPMLSISAAQGLPAALKAPLWRWSPPEGGSRLHISHRHQDGPP